MKTKIKLYGHLVKKARKELTLDVETVGEAIRAIDANYPGFKSHLSIHSSPGYRVIVGGEVVNGGDLNKNIRGKTIKIVPVVAGAGKNIGQIILGVVLIVASIYFPPLAGSAYAVNVGMMGAAMVLGGVAGILAPSPNMDTGENEKADNKPNYSFNGPVNAVGQGNAISVLYGELIVGGQIISAGLSTHSNGGGGANDIESALRRALKVN